MPLWARDRSNCRPPLGRTPKFPMKKIQFRFLLLISGWLFLGAAVEAQTFTTPPPATASLGAYIPIAGNAPAVLPPPQVSLLIIWTQTPSGTWTNQVVASGVGGTLSGSTTVTLNATGTWHFAIGSVAPPPPGSGAAPSGNYASASTVVKTPITAATIASNLNYNGSAQYPNSVSSVTPTGATVTVSATGSQTNAGTYNTGTVTGTGNYSGTLSNLSWTINKINPATPTVSASPNPVTCGSPTTVTPGNGTTNQYAWIINGTTVSTYNGSSWSPGSGTYSGGSWTTSGLNLVVTPSSVTNFTVNFRDTGNVNYNPATSSTLTVTVNPGFIDPALKVLSPTP